MPYIKCKGHNIFYINSGAKTSLPPVVLVHGAWANHVTWVRQIKYLSKYTEVFCFDLLGHGKSDKPNVEYTIDHYSAILKDFIIKLSIHDPVIVGHSLGGFITQLFAIKNPELFKKVVVLCSGVNITGTQIKIPSIIIPFMKKALFFVNYSIFCRINDKSSYANQLDYFKGLHLEERMAASCSASAIKNMVCHLITFDISDKLHLIKKPILFQTGTKDMFYGQRKIYKRLKNARIEVQKDGPHPLHLDAKINETLLDFIKQ